MIVVVSEMVDVDVVAVIAIGTTIEEAQDVVVPEISMMTTSVMVVVVMVLVVSVVAFSVVPV
jgi:hypothetical protein